MGDWILVGSGDVYFVGQVYELAKCFVLPGTSCLRLLLVSVCHAVTEEHWSGGAIKIPHSAKYLAPVVVRVESASMILLSRSDDGCGNWLYEYSF